MLEFIAGAITETIGGFIVVVGLIWRLVLPRQRRSR